MKTLKSILLLICPFLFCTIGCGDDDVSITQIISIQAPDSVLGNGSSSYKIIAFLHPSADKSLREVEFKITGGSFEEADEDNPTEVKVKANFFNDTLSATVNWNVPAKKGNIIISAEPVLEDKSGHYLATKNIYVDTSIVASLELTAAAFSVYNNFDEEVMITGRIKNSSGGGVSSGTKVVIRDVFESNGAAVNGRFRSESLESNSSSSISAVYSPGPIAPNQDILLIGTVLNQDGSPSTLRDTIKLFINQKN